jgi:dihydrofolate reductase
MIWVGGSTNGGAPPLRELVAHLIITLDGVVQLEAVHDAIVQMSEGKVEEDMAKQLTREDAMLLGRKTYDAWSQFWPLSNIQPFADHINSVRKYVVTSSLKEAPWGTAGSATVVAGDLRKSILKLKSQQGKTIGVHGSPSLVRSLVRNDLLDRLHLMLVPIVAGAGARLFEGEFAPQKMKVVNLIKNRNGVLAITYRPEGPLRRAPGD